LRKRPPFLAYSNVCIERKGQGDRARLLRGPKGSPSRERRVHTGKGKSCPERRLASGTLLFIERDPRWSPGLMCMHVLLDRWSALEMLPFGGSFNTRIIPANNIANRSSLEVSLLASFRRVRRLTVSCKNLTSAAQGAVMAKHPRSPVETPTNSPKATAMEIA
jgi:hypothetical protein